MKQIRRYLIARDKRIVDLWLGTNDEEPLAPKEIGIRLNISRWAVYRVIEKARAQNKFSQEKRRMGYA